MESTTETLDDIVEEMADHIGVYGCGARADGDHPEHCGCRICFTIGLKERIEKVMKAEMEEKLTMLWLSSQHSLINLFKDNMSEQERNGLERIRGRYMVLSELLGKDYASHEPPASKPGHVTTDGERLDKC